MSTVATTTPMPPILTNKRVATTKATKATNKMATMTINTMSKELLASKITKAKGDDVATTLRKTLRHSATSPCDPTWLVQLRWTTTEEVMKDTTAAMVMVTDPHPLKSPMVATDRPALPLPFMAWTTTMPFQLANDQENHTQRGLLMLRYHYPKRRLKIYSWT